MSIEIKLTFATLQEAEAALRAIQQKKGREKTPAERMEEEIARETITAFMPDPNDQSKMVMGGLDVALNPKKDEKVLYENPRHVPQELAPLLKNTEIYAREAGLRNVATTGLKVISNYSNNSDLVREADRILAEREK